jgi:hypothetical protein
MMDIVEQFLSTARSQIEEYYVELWREHESLEPEHLFHYTSTEGLVGILTSRKFFASDMLASNDRSEFRHGVELTKSVLRETAADPLSMALLDSFSRGDGLVGLGRDYFIHAICFCPGKDVLTQWRAYSSTGGFAIGVNFKQLRERAENLEFAIARIMYREELQRDIIRKTVVHAKGAFESLRANLDSASPPEFKRGLDAFLLEVGISLLKSIHHFKNEAFQSEDEWRIFPLVTIEEARKNLKFKSHGSAITPYVEVPFEPELISHICRSPGLWSGAVDYAVQRLADTLSDHVCVEVSKLPL